MSESTESSRTSKTFLWTSWIPLASLVAAHLYVDRFEGWGQWAAAPVLLGPVVLSAAFLLLGVLVARAERLSGRVRPSTWVASGLVSVPLLWIVWRLIVTL